MDFPRWKFILHDWIRKTELIPTAVGSLEHIDANLFYDKFRNKIQETNSALDSLHDLGSFLKENFPSFEVELDESENISPQDSIFIFSLLFYYSCVLRVNDYFQKCCKSLDAQHQTVVVKFFGILNQHHENKKIITKVSLCSAIRESSPSPPSIRFISSSPSLRTPDKAVSTPNNKLIFEKTKEIQRLKSRLENERYEKNMAEAEAKQNEQKIELLVKEQKTLKHELQKLRTEQMMDSNSENLSPNKVIRDEQMRVKMQKEIDAREETIVNLRCEIDALTSKNEKSNNRMLLVEKEMRDLRRKCCDFEETVDSLQEELEDRVKLIRTLEESNAELMAFINETRSTNIKDSSSDCLDFSFSTSNAGENSRDSGENLAKQVVEVQLKEKEIENQKLLDDLHQLTSDNKKLKLDLNAHEKTISLLQNELKLKSSFEKQLSEKSAELMALEMKCQQQKVELETMHLEMKECINNARDKEKLSVLKAENDMKMFNEQVNGLQSAINNLTQQCENKEKQLIESAKEIDRLKEDNLEQVNCLKKQLEETKLASSLENLRVKELLKKLENFENLKKDLKELENLHHKAIECNKLLDANLLKEREEKDVMMKNFEQERLFFESQLEKESENVKKTRLEYEEKLDSHEKTISSLQNELELKSSFEKQLSEKSAKLMALEKECQQQKVEFEAMHLKLEECINNAREKEKLSSLETENDMKMFNEQVKGLQSAIKNLTQQCENKEKQLIESTKEIDRLKEDNLKQVNCLKKQLEEIKLASSLENLRVRELLKKLENFENLKENLKELENLHHKAIECNKLLDANLLKEREEKDVMMKSFEQERLFFESQLEKESENVKKTRLEYEEKLDSHEKTISSLQNELELKSSFEKQLSEKSAKLMALETECQQQKVEFESMHLKLEECINNAREKEKLSSLKTENDIKMLNEQVNGLQSAINKLTQQCENKEKQLIESTKEIDRLKEDSLEQVNCLKKQLEEIKLASSLENLRVRELLKKLENFENLKENLKELENLHHKAIECNKLLDANLLKEREEKDVMMKSFEQERLFFESQLEKGSENVKKTRLEYEEKLDSHEKTISSLQNELELKSSFEKQLSEKSAKLMALETACQQQKVELESMHLKLEECINNDREKEKLSSLKTENDIKMLNEQVNGLQSAINKLTQQCENKEKQLIESTKEIDRLKEDNLEQVNCLKKQLEEIKLASSLENLRVRELLKKLENFENLKENLKELENLHHKAIECNKLLDANLLKEREEKDVMMKSFEQERLFFESQLEKESENVKKTRLEYEEKLDSHEKTISSLQNELELKSSFEKQLSEKSAELMSLEVRCQQQKVELEAMHLKMKECINNARDEEKLSSLETENDIKMLNEQVNGLQSAIKELTQQCENKEKQLIESTKEIDRYKEDNLEQVNCLKKQLEATKLTSFRENLRVRELLKKLENFENLKENLNELESLHHKAVECNKLLNDEKSVLNAKLLKEREEKDVMKKKFEQERLFFESQLEKESENVKETRLEYAGKLEKMTEKMKSILNDQVERKDAIIAELENRNENLVMKSEQSMSEIEYLRRKLQFMERNGRMEVPSNIGMSRAPSTMQQITGSNFGMEDEAGEEFSNTYLTELKEGVSKQSVEKIDKYSTKELQIRNSMVQQHLRGSYAIVNLDRSASEQEIRDGALFDDSQAALLSNNAPRKKQSTSYKRPGPPTPSKNSGRLSIDPNTVNPCNALKDSTNTSKKTPNRFKNIFSSSSRKDSESVDNHNVLKSFMPSMTPKGLNSSLSSRHSNDDDEESKLLNRSWKNKQKIRQQQRDRVRDQNRPNLLVDVPMSPEYEVLNISFEAYKSSEDDEKTSFVRGNLNESFEHIKQREKWQLEQKQARRKYFARNRRASYREQSKIEKHDEIGKSSGSTSELESSISADDYSRYQSCKSLSSDAEKKGITRNFIMSHHSQVNRLSDIYVRSAPNPSPWNNEEIVQNKTWLDVKSFILGFFFAFATIFKSFFKAEK